MSSGYQARDYQIDAVKAVQQEWARGVRSTLVVLPTGCHAKGQNIRMFDGSVKAVEDIAVGELLMGPDSKPRTVLQLARGVDEMFDVVPINGEPWRVNGDHVLSLVKCQQRSANSGRTSPSEQGTRQGEYIDVTVREWLSWSKYRKHIHKLVRVPVEYPKKDLPIDPWLLGVILGDGSVVNLPVTITNPDDEILAGVSEIVGLYGCKVSYVSSPERCRTYSIIGNDRSRNGVSEILKTLGLDGHKSGDKFIPECYQNADRTDRLKLLAGLMDTDGHLSSGGYDYVTKSHRMACEIETIARSVGFAVSHSIEKKGCQNGFEGVYSRLNISGNVSEIPVRITRKAAGTRRQKKNVLRTGFCIVPVGKREEFFGFALDGDHRYLLDDFTVTHNTGKTVVASQVVAESLGDDRMLFICHREELVSQTIAKLRQITGFRVAAECGDRYRAYRSDPFAKIIVATEQSMIRRKEKYKPDHFGMMLDDESHHATGATRGAIRDYFESGLKRIVGFTATPKRADEIALGRVFDSVAFERNILWAIDEGWLTPIRNRLVQCDQIDLRKVKLRAGEFDRSEMVKIMGIESLVDRMVRQTIQIADGRQTVMYCNDIAQAQAVHRMFQHLGERSVYIDGKTEKSYIRPERLRAFRDQRAQFFVNVAVATEGLDIPGIEVVAMAKPTRSQVFFMQCAGRGLRPVEPPMGQTATERCAEIRNSIKPHCTLIDFVGIIGKHMMAFGGDVLGGNYDDDVRKLAIQIASKMTGDIDMRQVLLEAAEKIRKRNERKTKREHALEEKRRERNQNREAERRWCFSMVPNPYTAWSLDTEEAASLPRDAGYGAVYHQSLEVLKDAKFQQKSISHLSNLEQVYLARQVVLRAKQGLASWAQTRLLYPRGYDTSKMTRQRASWYLTRLSEKDWLRPSEDGPNPVYEAWLSGEKFSFQNLKRGTEECNTASKDS